MELLDVFDENGNFIGVSKPRQKVHEEGLWHKIACVFIINSKGEVLMQKRSEFKMTNPNGWTCSASGHVDAGENALTGALRELKEEIGVKAKEDDLKHIGTVFENYFTCGFKVRHISEVYLMYKDIKVDDLVYQEEEVAGAKYFKIDEVEKCDFKDKHPGIFELLKTKK